MRSKKLGAVDLSMYQGAKSFIEEIILEKDATEDTITTNPESLTNPNFAGTNPFDRQIVKRSAPRAAGTNQLDRPKFESFLHELALATLGPASDVDTESLRSARIHLGLTISRSKVVSSETRKTLDAVFTSWLEYERSRPLRLLVEQAISANKTSSSE